MGRGNSVGSGSGSGTGATAHNAPNQPLPNSTQLTGSGSGSGSSTMTTVHGNASTQRVLKVQPMSSGTGTGYSGGSGTGSVGSGTGSGLATVSGQVWLDNNGDGSIDNGEMGYQDITVALIYASTGSVVDPKTTDANGDFNFNLLLGPNPDSFEIQVYLGSVPYVAFNATDPGPGISQINANGTSGVFNLASGGWRDIEAGICSTTVTTLDDDPNGVLPEDQDLVTLRDAIETANNGDGLNQNSTLAVNFVNPQNGQPLSGTIVLQDALPDIVANYDIDGPGASILTVQAPGGSSSTTAQAPPVQAPLHRVFTIKSGIHGIAGLTIEKGIASGDNGGGIYNAATLLLTDDDIYDNQAVANNGGGNGGGIYNAAGAKLIMVDTHVYLNSADGYGGGIDNVGTLIVNSSQIYVNSAKYGAGMANQQTGSIAQLQKNTQIYSNGDVNTSQGGGIYNTGGTASMTGSSGGYVRDNSAASGGGIYVSSGKLTLKAETIDYNKATTGNGGGIYIDNGDVTASGTGAGLIDDNTAMNGNGGGIYSVVGTLTLTGFNNNPTQNIGPGNSAINGGGMYLGNGSLTNFKGVLVSGNKLSAVNGKGVGIAYEKGALMFVFPNGLTDKDDGGNPVPV